MSDPDLEQRLRRALDDAGPSDELLARLRRTAAQAAREHGERRRRGRRPARGLLLAAAAVVVLGGGAATAAVVMSGDGGDPAVPLAPGPAAAVRESAVLARAPWLAPGRTPVRIQETRPAPSLRFAAGTSYPAALRSLVASIAADGTLPDEARLAGPLPRGVVFAPRGAGARLDLTAPFGYGRPSGVVLPPTLRLPASLSQAEALRVARAFRAEGLRAIDARLIDIPRLAPCQRLPRRAPCRLAPVEPPPSRDR